MWKISEEGLQNLKKHKYQGSQYTPIDNIMNHFWMYLVNFLPFSLAPNLITLIACLLNQVCVPILIYYEIQQYQAPWYIYLWIAISIFIYQTLDALDGKQARRTGNSSPLGMLFDHGCDSYTLTMFCLIFCFVINLEENFEFFLISLFSYWGFFCVSWEDRHKNITRTSVGILGVTEAQFYIMFHSILTMIYGKSFWDTEITVVSSNLMKSILGRPSIKLKYFSYLFSCLSPFLLIFTTLFSVLKGNNRKLFAIGELFPLILFSFDCVLLYYTPFCQKNILLVIFLLGVEFSLIDSRLIISSATKMKFNLLHFELFYPIAFSLIDFGIHYYFPNNNNEKAEYVLFGIFYSIIWINTMKYLYSVIYQIADFLEIPVFTNKLIKKEDNPK